MYIYPSTTQVTSIHPQVRMWQDRRSEKGCRELLSQLSDADIETLLEACTRGRRVETREGKIEAILNVSQSAEGLLRRKLFTKNVLIKYAHPKGINVIVGLNKTEIQGRIIKYWRNQKPQSDDTTVTTPKHPETSPARPASFQKPINDNSSSSSSTNHDIQVVHSFNIKTKTFPSATKPPQSCPVRPKNSQVPRTNTKNKTFPSASKPPQSHPVRPENSQKPRTDTKTKTFPSASKPPQSRPVRPENSQKHNKQRTADAGKKRTSADIAIIDELSDMKAKRMRLEEDSADLSKRSNSLVEEADREGKLHLLKEAIALRKESEAKWAEAVALSSSIEEKIKALSA